MGEVALSTGHCLPAVGSCSDGPCACSTLCHRTDPAYITHVRGAWKRNVSSLVPWLWLDVEGKLGSLVLRGLCLHNLICKGQVFRLLHRIGNFTHVPVHHFIQGRYQKSVAGSLQELDLNRCICHKGGATGYVVHPFIKGGKLWSKRCPYLIESRSMGLDYVWGNSTCICNCIMDSC